MKNQSEIKLSVCISCYNEKAYIERAIQSVLDQDLPFAFEILIGDDGSTDGSYELLLEKYGSKENIHLFQLPRDKNVHEEKVLRHSKMIKFLLQKVKGEYFSVLDGDDYYCDKNAFKRKIAILDDPQNKDCVLCISNFKLVYMDGTEKIKIPNERRMQLKRNFESSMFGDKNGGADPYLCLATALVRSGIISYIDDKATPDFDDWYILIWAKSFGNRYYDDKVVYAYEQHENSVLHTMSNETSLIRWVLNADVLNYQWKNKYRCRMLYSMWGTHLIKLFPERATLREVIDYDSWFPIAEEYHGYAYKLLNYYDLPKMERLLFFLEVNWIRVQHDLSPKMVYLFESIKFLLSVNVSITEKINRITKVLFKKDYVVR